MAAIRYLINENGESFEKGELDKLTPEFEKMSDKERENYSNDNTKKIVENTNKKTLIVSGPGTGKSYLFLEKIRNWHNKDDNANILVSSFVGKLVRDLRKDIDTAKGLNSQQKKRVKVSTLHSIAMGFIESNCGCSRCQLNHQIKIINDDWKDMVWDDVLNFFPEISKEEYSWNNFEKKLNDNNLIETGQWKEVADCYFDICHLYNAVNFSSMIILARLALEEKEDNNKYDYFIVDEYQDFNLAEDALIREIIKKAKGVLLAGDDEQLLYERKNSKAEIIRKIYYEDASFSNGMLPFCRRCGYHIVKVADYFIKKSKTTNSIEKAYLPLSTDASTYKVQAVGFYHPAAILSYVENFIKNNSVDINKRKVDLESGKNKDSFLLILSPDKKLGFLDEKYRKELNDIIEKYEIDNSNGEDYEKISYYYKLSSDKNDNFNFRKVLFFEDTCGEEIHNLIKESLLENKKISELSYPSIEQIVKKSENIKEIIDGDDAVIEKIKKLEEIIKICDKDRLQKDLLRQNISEEALALIEEKKEEPRVNPIELMSISGSKGLSSDHVMILGFDNINMGYVTRDAFYVAITRPRKSLHLFTSIRVRGANSPNKFIDNLPQENIDFCFYIKKDGSRIPYKNKNCYLYEFSRCKRTI